MVGFSILWETLLAFSFAYFMLPLIVKSWRPYRYLYISKIHLACAGLTWDKFNETSTSAGSLPLLSCLVTFSDLFSILYVYFSLMKLFAGLLKVTSRGWNLLVRLWGTRMRTQLFSQQSLATASLACPLKVSIVTRLILSFE